NRQYSIFNCKGKATSLNRQSSIFNIQLQGQGDFHKSEIINHQSAIPWAGLSGLGDLLLQIEASHAICDKFIKLNPSIR
ncbi:MAG: hypothetical protein V3T59_05070, partial [Desulfobacterales bacterium]